MGTQWVVSPEQLEKYITSYDALIEPDDHERTSTETPNIIALSFFSGAMGLDIGMAQGGIRAILACEFNKFCRMTINENEPDMALIGDINAYSPEDILKMAKIPEGRKVDVIFGGPPCQALVPQEHEELWQMKEETYSYGISRLSKLLDRHM